MTPDMINAIFEIFGSLLVGNHCRVLLKDRSVKGVSIFSTIVFAAWGVWNLFWYTGLHQPFSFYGSVVMMLANVTYVGLMIYFRQKEKNVVFSK